MTDAQIRQIMERLEQQDKDALAYRVEREKLDEERQKAQYEVWRDFRLQIKTTNENIASISEEVKPIIDLATSVRGFDKIGMWIVKFLLGLGALIGAGGTILYFLRKLIAPNND